MLVLACPWLHKERQSCGQHVFIVKMRGLGDLGPLFASIPLGSPVILPVLSVRSTHLAVLSVATNFTSNTQLVANMSPSTLPRAKPYKICRDGDDHQCCPQLPPGHGGGGGEEQVEGVGSEPDGPPCL
eukprot:TRINITY_DN34157_c0_g1_i1.p1 TRINITY_DN34157_c0_g1~~TRINITY_DN34157_c0_g1_i1.p1  ORF type:complete len:128 (+),score=12.52 TRINITY_DN34157_c0_g1_i1:360-743(+)